MLFKEKKEGEQYYYEVEDLFGIIRIRTHRKLNPEELDLTVVKALEADTALGEVADLLTYEYEKANRWLEDDPMHIEVSLTLWEKIKNIIKGIIKTITLTSYEDN